MFILYALIGLILAAPLGLFLKKFYFTERMRMTSVTIGTVVSAEERVIVERDIRRVETQVLVRFLAGGKAFEVATVLRGARAAQLPAGHSVGVRYNPGHPQMAEIAG